MSVRAGERMRFDFKILPQPDNTTCGPTCLHAVYHHFGERMPLPQVIQEAYSFEGGGTLAVFMGIHALRADTPREFTPITSRCSIRHGSRMAWT